MKLVPRNVFSTNQFFKYIYEIVSYRDLKPYLRSHSGQFLTDYNPTGAIKVCFYPLENKTDSYFLSCYYYDKYKSTTVFLALI